MDADRFHRGRLERVSDTEKDTVKAARRAAALLLDDPWYPVGSIGSWQLSRQLARELAPGHRMHGRKWHAVARCDGSDDVLFVSETGEIADVHMTWSTPVDSKFPSAGFHESVEAFSRWLDEEKAYVAMIVAQDEAEEAVAPGSAVCGSCGADWGLGKVTDGCNECGGFALVRTCPICGGGCISVWKRAIADSNDSGEAHWVGSCTANNPFEPS